jgi:hypothetical protein
MHLRDKEYDKVLPACNSFFDNWGKNVNDASHNPAIHQKEILIDSIGARLLRGTFLMFSKQVDDAKADFARVILHPLSPQSYKQEFGFAFISNFFLNI